MTSSAPRVDDYPIFFATMQEPSKDNSGDKIYVKRKDIDRLSVQKQQPVENCVADAVDRYEATPKDLNEFVLDAHEHLIVKHDLFNHDGLTQDGIAEAFIEFAKKEQLKFFSLGPFDEARYRALLEGLEVSEVDCLKS